MTLEITKLDSLNKGVNLAVFGAIHGNEICGTTAIRRVVKEIQSAEIIIKSGSITFIPICNPKAYKQNVRFIERNLNRFLVPNDNPVYYEDKINNHICKVLRDVDFLLDIHSYGTEGESFAFLGLSEEENNFARALGTDSFVYGWAEAFNSSGKQPNEGVGTTEYSRMNNTKAITLECGFHENKNNSDIAYKAIINALKYHKIIEGEVKLIAKEKAKCAKMQKIFYKEKEGNFTNPVKHMTAIKRNSVIADYLDGTQISSGEDDAYIVLPKYKAKQGAEWFYLGVKTEFPKL